MAAGTVNFVLTLNGTNVYQVTQAKFLFLGNVFNHGSNAKFFQEHVQILVVTKVLAHLEVVTVNMVGLVPIVMLN